MDFRIHKPQDAGGGGERFAVARTPHKPKHIAKYFPSSEAQAVPPQAGSATSTGTACPCRSHLGWLVRKRDTGGIVPEAEVFTPAMIESQGPRPPVGSERSAEICSAPAAAVGQAQKPQRSA